MQRLRKTVRPASSVAASAFSCRPARIKAAVTGGADFKLVSQLARTTAQIGNRIIPSRRRFISERESEDRPQLEIGLVASARDLAECGQRCPTRPMPNGDVGAGKKFPRLGFGPVWESDLVDELSANEKARADLVAQA